MARNYKHGQACCNKRTAIYNIWTGIKQRCTNPLARGYKHNGAIGGTVCKRWLDRKDGFANFFEDMGEIPKKSTERWGILRIDPSRPYEPGNCKWVLWKEFSNPR